ncbi:MAG: 23S rRNA pseudouridine(1911/1915/1917) synthase RluD [Rhodocyclaceae bacterium]|nr:23S rRNA pseudouridine(1911/1915/1917) synthase RluD [Rhodocyclaceae bacterium]
MATLDRVNLTIENPWEEEPEEYSSGLPAAPPSRIEIPAALAGQRIDQALAQLLPEHSRNRLQGWVREGAVLLDGVQVAPKHKVWGGEWMSLSLPESVADETHAAQDIPLRIVFEDDTLIVIDKPVGLVVHPGNGNRDGTLLNALLHHDPALAALPRAGIVHRLDKDTSGLMVVARTLQSQTDLVRQLQARSVSRHYLALAQGSLAARQGTVDEPIGRHPVHRTRMAVVASGKPAVTHYTVRRRYEDCTLVECRLETGRTHQIRVHLAHLGHPLVGDALYAGRRHRLGPAFPRQALHAFRLALVHPASGQPVAWEVPLADDLTQLIDSLERP